MRSSLNENRMQNVGNWPLRPRKTKTSPLNAHFTKLGQRFHKVRDKDFSKSGTAMECTPQLRHIK